MLLVTSLINNNFMKFNLSLVNIYILIFPLFFYSCYFYIGLNPQFVKLIYYLLILFSLFIFFKKFTFTTSGNYIRLVKLIIIIIVFSSINAYLFWNQDFSLTYQSTSWCLGLIYFFVLLYCKPNIKLVEKIILIYGLLYIILWSYAMIKAPTVLFSASEELKEFDERGITRINLSGYTAIVLSFFMSINKFFDTKNRRWLYLFVIFAIFIVLQVIRQVIFFSFIIAFIYIFRKKIKIVIIGSILLIVSSAFLTFSKFDENSIFGNMILLSKEQFENNKKSEEDIRVQEYKFFLTNYSKNAYTSLLGNGVSNSKSDFGKFSNKLINNYMFYSSDVGYAELYIRFGIITIFLYFIILYKVIKQKIINRFVYAKLFIYYLFLGNIASAPITSDAVFFAICLYILEYNFWINKVQTKKLNVCSQ